MFNFIKRMKKKDIIFSIILFSTVPLAVAGAILKNNIQNTGQIILAMILIAISIPFWDELGRRNINRP